MIARAGQFNNLVAFHFGVVKQLMAPLRTVVNPAVQLCTTMSLVNFCISQLQT